MPPALFPQPTTLRRLALLFLVALALLLSVPVALSQDARTITLAEAVELARTQSVAVQQAGFALEQRDAAVAEARGQYYPALSFYTAGGQNYGLSFDETAGQLTQQTTEAFEVGGQAEWTVYDGGERRARLALAQADRSAGAFDQERVRQTAVNDVLRQFYEVVVAGAELEVAQANVEAQRQQLALVDAAIGAGVQPRVERLQQEERLAEAEFVSLEAARSERGAALQLVRLLALDPSGDYRFVAPTAPAGNGAELGLDTADLIEAALEHRSDLRAQEAAVASAEAGLQAARAGRRPSLSLIAGYGTSFTTGTPGGLGPQLGDNRGGVLGFEVGLPLFDRHVTRSRVRAASARVEGLQLTAEEGRRAVALEVREAVLDYDLLVEQLAVAERRLTAAQAALAAETARYRLGATTLPVLAEVRARAVEAEVGLERTRSAVVFQEALIQYRTGTLGLDPPWQSP